MAMLVTTPKGGIVTTATGVLPAIFDDSVPLGRLCGHQLSRAMVWLTTFSLDVSDPLCGFRGIPLAATVALLDETPTGDHMEFDPELVIQLCWRGVPVRNVPTRVVYVPEGVSHFDVFWDNVRMTRIYTKSVLGAVWRRRSAAGWTW